MKKTLPVLFAIAFVVGIIIILTADTGRVADYTSAQIAGTVISFFSGCYLGLYFFQLFRTK